MRKKKKTVYSSKIWWRFNMRTKKALKNLLFSFIQQLVGIVTSFIVPPLIIGTFGSAINGLVATIKQLTAYVQLVGSGIASVSTYSLYDPLAKEDKKKINGIYNASSKAFTKAGNIFSLLVLILAIIYSLVIEKGINNYTVFALVIVMGIAGASEFFIVGKYQALLNADQKNFVFAIAQSLGNIFLITMTIILIKLKQDIVIVQFGASIVYLMRIIIVTIYVKKHYPYLDKKVPSDNTSLVQRGDAIIHEVAGLVIASSSVVIISLLIGLKEASVYSVYLLVFSGLNMISISVSNAIYASFGDAISKNENELLNTAYDIYEWLYLLMVFIIYGSAFFLIDPFISVYTAKMIDVNYNVAFLGQILAIAGLLNNIKTPPRTIITAAGHFKKTKNRALIELLINIASQLVLVPFFGLIGAAAGNLLSALYRSIDMIIYSNREILGISNRRIATRLFSFGVSLLILIGFVPIFFPLISANYKDWTLLAIKVTFLSAFTYLFVQYLFEKNTFKQSYSILKNILKKN